MEVQVRTTTIFFAFLLTVSLLVIGCETTTNADKIAVIKGTVVEETGSGAFRGVPQATVFSVEYFTSTTTNDNGEFVLSIELDEKNQAASTKLEISKTGYETKTVDVNIRGGDTTLVPSDKLVLNRVATNALLRGRVVADTGTGRFPLENVTVSFSGVQEVTYTGSDGQWEYVYNLNKESSKTINVYFNKSGYRTVTLQNRLIQNGVVSDFGEVVMPRDTSSTTGGEGEPYYLEIVGISSQHIYVKGSGLPEVAQIEFNVKDNQGNPIDDRHAVTVHFEILAGPGGGETIYPTQMETIGGYAKTSIQAGTRAGVVQIRAWFNKESGELVDVKPIQIAIWGGLPDQAHFIIGAEKLNIAGMARLGLLDNITAYLGDKYGNPVAPGTVVYFTTRWGYIEGSNPTDNLGRSTVQLISAAPLPSQYFNTAQLRATPDTAITTIWGYTFNENHQRVSDRAFVLFSAPTNQNIWVDTVPPPTQGYLERNDVLTFFYSYDTTSGIAPSQTFYYRITDIYGNPLAAGANITVSATEGKVSGDISVRVPDALVSGEGITDFRFTWNAPQIKAGDDLPLSVSITISVSTNAQQGNGDAAIEIKGFLR